MLEIHLFVPQESSHCVYAVLFAAHHDYHSNINQYRYKALLRTVSTQRAFTYTHVRRYIYCFV